MLHDSPPPNYQPEVPAPEALQALRAALIADPQKADDLVAISERLRAIEALAEFGSTIGLSLSVEALNNALRGDPLRLDRFFAQPVNALTRPGPFWLPTGLGSDGAQITLEWAHFGVEPLVDPFFEAALRRARNHPVSVLMGWRTPLSGLLDDPDLQPPPRFDGLIFHMSRCGSTLVARALAALSECVVLSEPAPFDEVLQLCASREDIPFEMKVALLRGMATALSSPRTGPVRRRFLKTDCWHAGALPLLRAAFPDTPWIFLYRDPVDVLMSHARMPGSQTLPGPHAALVGIDPAGALPGIEFTARVLAATCQAAADHAALGGGVFIDYATLPKALADEIFPHFGVAPDPDEAGRIASVLAQDAKSPNAQFMPEEYPPRASASAEVLAASDRHLAGAVSRLRAITATMAD